MNGPDGLCRKMSLRSSASFANLEREVRVRLNDLNTPLNMSYQLTLTAKKGVKMAPESQAHWVELVDAVRQHGKKKVNGQFHAFVYHFMDDQPNKASAKGKATTTAQTATKEVSGSTGFIILLAQCQFVIRKWRLIRRRSRNFADSCDAMTVPLIITNAGKS